MNGATDCHRRKEAHFDDSMGTRGGDDKGAKLERLAERYDRGKLTEAGFEAQMQTVLRIM